MMNHEFFARKICLGFRAKMITAEKKKDSFLEDEIKNTVIKPCLERNLPPTKCEMFPFIGV